MAELRDLMEAFLERGGSEASDKAKELSRIYMDEGTPARMHDDAIRWTMHEVFMHGLSTMGGTKDDKMDACRQWAKMMRACAEHLIRHKELRHPERVPNIDWWHSVVSCKEAS